MNKKKPYLYKRVIAYGIDFLIVVILSGILAIIITGNDNKYEAEVQKMIDLVEKRTNEEITSEEYNNELKDISYSMSKESVPVTVITLGVSIVYYVIMCYFCHGITLGKYIVKIKITSANNKKLTIFNYFLRSIIINMILFNAIDVILISTLEKEAFIKYDSLSSNLLLVTMLLSFIFMLYREDGRGLHDLLGNTKIINIKDEEQIEGEIVEEK